MKKVLFVFLMLLGTILILQAQDLNIATYNIRVDKKEDVANGNGWQQRCPRICDLVRFHDFDIFGAQEVEFHQLQDLLKGLPQYAYTGVARDDGKQAGEFVPVFYKKDKFTLIKSGNFWLAPNPGIPGKGWDAACFRICTWGEFIENGSGFRFWFFNVHLDHRGSQARKESAKLILSQIKELADADASVILSGDFNTDQTTEVYTLFCKSELLDDSYEKAISRHAWTGTANNFDPSITTDSRLDHIFVSPALKVIKYGILTDTYREITDEETSHLPNFPKEVAFQPCSIRFPSDHYPVQIILRL